MKAVVGFAFFLMFLGGLVFVTLLGPKMARESTTGGGAGLTGIIWRAVAIGDEFLPEDSGVFILFEVDGSFSGNGGCNSVEGNLEQKETGIAVGPIAATEMACPGGTMGRENRFFEALRVTRGFEADAENMRLLDEGGAVLLVFVAAGG